MKKFLLFTFLAITISFASFAQGEISGPSNGCIGSTYNFSDSLYPGGTWSSSNMAVATIDASSGNATAISAGTTSITYTYGSSYTTTSFTVAGIMPESISETSTSFCAGATATCTDPTSGGTWSSDDTYVATISATGVVTGINGGTVDISYTIGSCSATISNTINAPDAGILSAPVTICIGSTETVVDSSNGTTGGSWSSSNPSVATVDANGMVTGISAGTATITYTVTNSCGSASATTIVTISNTTNPGTISGGNSSIYANGGTATLTDYSASAAGTWSSSDPSIASINASSGFVTGIATGTVTVTYTVDGCGGVATTTTTITVIPLNGISGNVYFNNSPYYGIVRVWLITYNPNTYDLEAIDSVYEFCNGTSSVYYQFTGVPTDSFRIKAACDSTNYNNTGYIPTYHTSSFYWGAANVLYHLSGTADANQDIDMAYDTVVTPGPGFIGGNVTTGANRTTSGGIPAVGLLMFAINASTGTLMQQTYTDASGNYSFTNLPVGITYEIYPEAINYRTTAYTDITLTSSSATTSAADFIQHTVSKTITPIISGVGNVASSVSSVITYPNPTTGKLNIQWKESLTEKGTVIITDITGREIYKTALNMNQGSGNSQIDLSGLADNVYIITIKSNSINYNDKIQVLH